MKKVLMMLCMLIFFFNTKAQSTINPVVDKTRATKTARVTSVTLTPEMTRIIIDIGDGLRKYSWAAVHSQTFIEYENPQTGTSEKKQILRLKNHNGYLLSMDYKYTYLPYKIFVLEFPSIPRNVKKINLIEEGGWKWYGINISPRNDIIVKRLATNEEEINLLIANSKNTNAAMYEQLCSTKSLPSVYKLAFIQTEEGIYLVYVGSINPIGSWECGEVKAKLRPTVAKNIYKADWYMSDKTIGSSIITFDGAMMKVHLDGYEEENVFVKMSGGNQFDEANTYLEKWSGTGFALKDGHILTNYHVVEDANVINIYGISGDFANGAEATVIGFDKSNDLALLKISGSLPASFNTIPYGFQSKIADVGEDVYVLGYPLTATMGEEVKLTNGIISAKSGFEGDVSQYQISVPIQPGNSGGPLIDYSGNVIGVVCAKHRGAENVSYAVKISQVRNLIESISDLSIMNTTNTLQGKPLKEQVKSVNKYVYIIKCSK